MIQSHMMMIRPTRRMVEKMQVFPSKGSIGDLFLVCFEGIYEKVKHPREKPTYEALIEEWLFFSYMTHFFMAKKYTCQVGC